ncbi:MarR family transcriptional regulator [Bosea sp. UNC402CLCol]|uniref:MarR family winged helix-turn-helix transcriptional regulator n=1 Tax=unclassified Bosea (in: a-proteobacteria) TaxID=2653178 RepID=UPI00068CE14F|nr:MarR family transcriptional regulator [Bosea sp. UNC402CLCol]
MRNEAARSLTFETPDALWQNDRVGAGMQRWRREFPDVDCSGKAIVGRLLHLNEVFQTAINRTLARHKLKYPSFAVLATLRVQGAPYRMSPKALLDTLILSSGGLSNLLRRLEKAGHVLRMADEVDGRGVIVELTEKGRLLVEPAMRDHAETERRLVAMLPPSERVLVAAALGRMMLANR